MRSGPIVCLEYRKEEFQLSLSVTSRLMFDTCTLSPCRCGASSAERERLSSRPLLPALVESLRRNMPADAADAANAVYDLYALGALDHETARLFDARMCLLLGPGSACGPHLLKGMARLLKGLTASGWQASRTLLVCVDEWLVANGDPDRAAGTWEAGAGHSAGLGPPGAAAELLCVLARGAWQLDVSLPAVWALARSAAEGAGAPVPDGFKGRKLAHTLFALARLVGRGQRSDVSAAVRDGATPVELRDAIARWARLAVAEAVPGELHASQDLSVTLWSLDALGVAPDAATAAAAVTKVIATAPSLEGMATLQFVTRVSQPLAAWHALGLVPDLEAVAFALALRPAKPWVHEPEVGMAYVRALEALMAEATLPVPHFE